MRSKPIRKLSLVEITALISKLKELAEARQDFNKLFTEQWGKVSPFLDENLSWAAIYEFSIIKHVAIFASLAGMSDAIVEASKSSNVLQSLEEKLETIELPSYFDAAPDSKKSSAFFVALYALMKSLECIEVMGTTINDLVVRAKAGDDRALFNAVRMDRSVINAPSVARRIAIAELTNDSVFFKKLSSAASRPQKNKPVDYGLLRYALMAVHETRQLDTMSEEERYELFCVSLGLYPLEGEDPLGSLNKFIRRWQKSLRT